MSEFLIQWALLFFGTATATALVIGFVSLVTKYVPDAYQWIPVVLFFLTLTGFLAAL